MKKTFLMMLLATLLCTGVGCDGDNPTTPAESTVSTDNSSAAETPIAPQTSKKTVYLYDETVAVTTAEYGENGRVSSLKTINNNGAFINWRTYNYDSGFFSVSERDKDGQYLNVRTYTEDGDFVRVDVYTENGISRWTKASDTVAENTLFNRDGYITQVNGYEGNASHFTLLAEQKYIYSCVYKNGKLDLRNDFKDGVQQKSTKYKADGSVEYTQDYVYDENGKNIRVDVFDAKGNTTRQTLYSYTDKGSYASVETKINGITTEKTEYSYDEQGKQTERRAYKYDDVGNPTEYEKWTITDGQEKYEGVFPATDK